MPIGIGLRPVAKQRIAKRSIAGKYSVENLQAPYNFPTGLAHTFTCPKSGNWLFVAWSAGSKSGATYAGCSGAYGEITKFLAKGQTVTITVSPESVGVLVNTVLTFPDGAVATCVSAGTDTPGTATGFDYSLSGSTGGAVGTSANGSDGSGTGGAAGGTGSGSFAGGAGAPGRSPFKGGIGAGTRAATFRKGATPGGGGCDSTTNDADVPGDGLVLAYLVRE